jgi:hypothetical protein
MQPKIAAQMFDNLVTQAGGKEAAASVISSAVGHPISIGTLSKIKGGNAEVPLLWAWALMDATGNLCFDSYRTATTVHDVDVCLFALSGRASEEGGQAVAAGIRAAQSGKAGDHAAAAVESREAAAEFTKMAEHFEAKAAGNVSQISRTEGRA